MSTSPDGERHAESLIDLAIRIGILAFLVYWTFLLVSPFLAIMLWSIVLAVALYPVFEWLSKCLGGHPRLAALVITVCCLLVTIGPVTWLGLGPAREWPRPVFRHHNRVIWPCRLLRSRSRNGRSSETKFTSCGRLPPAISRPRSSRVLPELKPLGTAVLGAAGSVGLSVLGFMASVVVAGFLLCPAPTLVGAVRAVAHKINPSSGEQFVILAGATIRNVARGVIGIAVIQTAPRRHRVGRRRSAGREHPHFCRARPGDRADRRRDNSAAVDRLELVRDGPDGRSSVHRPIWYRSTLSTMFFARVILGRGLRTPMLVILVGVIGGTLAHGLIGLFVGPIVLAVTWELLTAWIGRSDTEGQHAD